MYDRFEIDALTTLITMGKSEACPFLMENIISLISTGTKWELIQKIRDDIVDFKTANKLDKVRYMVFFSGSIMWSGLCLP